MKCPECDAWTSVLETRKRANGTKARRYQCANEPRFTTSEMVVKGKKGSTDADERNGRDPR